MNLGLKDKVVLVTGASQGIGYATAHAFAGEGARVVMAARNESKLGKAAEELKLTTGASIEPFPCDLLIESQCDELVQFIDKTFGQIDVLVNNAAGKLPMGNFLEMSSEEWLTAWTNKLQIYVTLSRLVFPIMRRQYAGRIICVVGAHAARNPSPTHLPIGVVSAGLVNFIKGLADLGAPDGILVTGVSPSGVDTGERWRAWLERHAAAEGKSIEEFEAQKAESFGLGRPGRPEEIGDAICFLGSERASFISGVVLTIDGNITRGVSL